MEKVKSILVIGRTGSGKSTLVNVLTKTNNFKEGISAVSETKEINSGEFELERVKYRIIDTVGIGDTEMSLEEVMSQLASLSYSVKEGLSQVFLVTNGKLTEETKSTYYLLEKVLFDEKIVDFTTIIRTNFECFQIREECERDCQQIVKGNDGFEEIIKKCVEEGRFVHVNNPPVGTGNEERDSVNEKDRRESRKILLNHLKNISQDSVYRPENLTSFNDSIETFLNNDKQIKKSKAEGIKSLEKKSEVLNVDEYLSKKMIDRIGTIDSKLKKRLENSLKKSNKSVPTSWIWETGIEKTKVLGFSIPNVVDYKDYLKEKIKEKLSFETPGNLSSGQKRTAELEGILVDRNYGQSISAIGILTGDEVLGQSESTNLEIIKEEENKDRNVSSEIYKKLEPKWNEISEGFGNIEILIQDFQLKEKLENLKSSAKDKIKSKQSKKNQYRETILNELLEVQKKIFFPDDAVESQEELESIKNELVEIASKHGHKEFRKDLDNLCQVQIEIIQLWLKSKNNLENQQVQV